MIKLTGDLYHRQMPVHLLVSLVGGEVKRSAAFSILAVNVGVVLVEQFLQYSVVTMECLKQVRTYMYRNMYEWMSQI